MNTTIILSIYFFSFLGLAFPENQVSWTGLSACLTVWLAIGTLRIYNMAFSLMPSSTIITFAFHLSTTYLRDQMTDSYNIM